MIEVKTADLQGAALDYAVAIATKAWEWAHCHYPTMTMDSTFIGAEAGVCARGEFGTLLPTCILIPRNPMRQDRQPFCPSIAWEHGGPLIDKHQVEIMRAGDNVLAKLYGRTNAAGDGATALIAACRAIVAAHLGDTVQIPDELAEGVGQ